MIKYKFAAEKQMPNGYWMFALIEVTAETYAKAREQVEFLVSRNTILGDTE